METILAAMAPIETHFHAGVHALNLARRIHARVLLLLICPLSSRRSNGTMENEVDASVKRRLSSLIEEARSEGITVEYYLAYGPFERELVSFIQENKITLLVVESQSSRDSKDEPEGFLDRIRHRIGCRIEVVNEKSEVLQRKE